MSKQIALVHHDYSGKNIEEVELEGIKINADDIVNYLKKDRFNDNCELGVSEFCPYHEARRLDMFYFNRWNRETRGYEIKISRSDFVADKKWTEYLKYCNWFYFIAPVGIIKPSELPEDIGLIEIEVVAGVKYDWQDKEGDEDKTNYYLSRKFVKKAKKLPPISEENYTRLLEGLLIKMLYKKNIVL